MCTLRNWAAAIAIIFVKIISKLLGKTAKQWLIMSLFKVYKIDLLYV